MSDALRAEGTYRFDPLDTWSKLKDDSLTHAPCVVCVSRMSVCMCVCERERESVCESACARERERERERQIERGRERQN